MYITSLVDTRTGVHSLLNSYSENDLVNMFSELGIVRKCKMNRHTRSAHQSKNYGSFVKTDEILDSDLTVWLQKLEEFVFEQNEKKDNDN